MVVSEIRRRHHDKSSLSSYYFKVGYSGDFVFKWHVRKSCEASLRIYKTLVVLSMMRRNKGKQDNDSLLHKSVTIEIIFSYCSLWMYRSREVLFFERVRT